MKIMIEYSFDCEVCYKKTTAKRSSKNTHLPKYCSNDCYRKASPVWLKHKEFSLKTEQEKDEHLRKYFERNVIKTDGCWDWKVAKNDKYPRMNHARKEPRIPIHHYSWEQTYGKISDGLFVCHKCDNTRCSNPEHLFLGTALDNNRDCRNKNRYPLGENHGNSKVTMKIASEIRSLLKLGVTMPKIAEKYNISYHTVFRIKHNKSWKN